MGIHMSDGPRRAPRSLAVWVLGVLSAVHGAGAFVFVAGGRTWANELEGFVMGTSAAVLLVGAILSRGLGRLRAEFRNPTSPQ
jgi:hypothetical protein